MLSTVPKRNLETSSQNGNNQLKHPSKVHDSSLPHHLLDRNGNMSFMRHEDGVLVGRGSAINHPRQRINAN